MNATALLLLAPLAVGHPPACATCNPGPNGPAMTAMGYPFPQPCPPVGPPAPVLAAKVVVPPGVVVGVGGAGGQGYPAGTQFGFRPGYRYRLVLSNIPGRPGVTLYPEIEILGSLVPRNGLNYLDFPATFVFSEQDLRRVTAGSLLTKVVYLEDPTKAIPAASTADRPIEIADPSVDDAWTAARDNGRVVAVVKIGDREPDPAELAGIGNTVLAPGMNQLGPAAAPAMFHWSGVPLFDPVLGPKPPTEECITDGGDKKVILGIGPNNKAVGLDPTDVSVEYTTGGKRKVATSNEVCICSPRFVVRTAEVVTGGIRSALHLGIEASTISQTAFSQGLATQAFMARDKAAEMDARIRPGIALNLKHLAGYTRSSRPAAIASSNGTMIVATAIEAEEITSYPDQLIVTKSVDPKGAVPVGGIVTVTIKYENRTKRPITDLVVCDSLSGRLEYISGSAKADRTANVTTAANEAGSVVVRFEIPGIVQPGQGGVVTFQVKVR